MRNVIEWMNTTSALLTALTAVLAGLMMIVRSMSALHWGRAEEHRRLNEATAARRWALALAIMLVMSGAGVLIGRYIVLARQPPNVRTISAAFDAFNAKQWKVAIAKADEIIDQFQAQAERQQAQMEDARAVTPIIGEASDSARKEILRRGVLNDVATSLWIKAIALLELGRTEEAKRSLQETAKYTYARCWDPNGWFWSPAEDASDRLKRMK